MTDQPPTPEARQAARTGALRESVKGRVGTWRKGTRIKATYLKGVGWSIERINKTQPLIHIANHMCGVPRSKIQFDNP